MCFWDEKLDRAIDNRPLAEYLTFFHKIFLDRSSVEVRFGVRIWGRRLIIAPTERLLLLDYIDP